MKVSIVGLGYVGLVTAVCFASKGIETVCYDVDEDKLKKVSRGIAPIYEPGLEELLTQSVRGGKLRVSSRCSEVVHNTDLTMITVGTPGDQDGRVDLSQVKSAAAEIGEALVRDNKKHLVVVKSTVPPGTTAGLVRSIIEDESGKTCGVGFSLCVNPEFLREGNAVYDAMNPDRIVIGEVDEGSSAKLLMLYEEFYGERLPPVLITNHVNAELIKYANNLFLAMRVSAINMIANICQRIPGADVEVVAKGIGMDHRIGPHFLRAGLGWGGSCWPKDLMGLKHLSRELGVDVPLLDATIEVNENQPRMAVRLAESELGELRGKRVSVLGLAFKPGTDDVRGAISIKLVGLLLERGAEVVVYDPVAMRNARAVLHDSVSYADSAQECIKDSDCCFIVTEWEEFKSLKPQDFVKLMRNPILIDGRRIYDPREFMGKLRYKAIGLGT